MTLIPNITVLDLGVNKSKQNFRILGCHKKDDPSRVKELVTAADPMDTYITRILPNSVLLHDITTAAQRAPLVPIQADIEALVATYGPPDHTFKAVVGNRIYFTRTRPGHCSLCARTHENDNTFYLRVVENDDETSIHQHCRHYDEDYGYGSVCLYSAKKHLEGVAIEPNKTTPVGWCLKNARRYKMNDHLFEEKVQRTIHEYAEPVLRPFELVPTLVIHAGMKMGKTKALSDYLATHFSSTIARPRIRFVSFRQTFSANIKAKFPDFTLYSDTTGLIYDNKVIIQVESLHRLAILPGDTPPELLILDECESIFEQFDSGLLKHFNECFAKFQYLLRYSKHVVCMDANISQRTINILAAQRPGMITYHHNKYKNAAPDTYYLTDNKSKWLGVLFAVIETERVAIPMSSLADAKVLYKVITEKYPNLRVHMYTSETSAREKAEHFGAVDNYWALYDVLIYTPTVSAGVSFEVKHYNKIFGYFSDQSCPVETCTQMMGRIRDVADKSYFIYLSLTQNYRLTSIEAIRAQIMARRESFHSSYDDMGLTAAYDATGRVVITESPYFQIYLENLRLKNISTAHFCRQMIHILGAYGATVCELTDDAFEQTCGYKYKDANGQLVAEVSEVYTAYKDNTRANKAAAIEDIYAAADITEARVSEIKALEEVCLADKHALERYYLRRHYNYEHPLTKKFISTYHCDQLKRNYKNLVRLANGGLESIKQVELETFAAIRDMGSEHHYRDIKFRYVYNQHRYAHGLLKMFGWKSIDDPDYVSVHDFRADIYAKHIHAICVEFNVRQTSNVNQMSSVLGLTNKILREMYGISIVEPEPGIYKLRPNGYFTTDPACITKPLIAPH